MTLSLVKVVSCKLELTQKKSVFKEMTFQKFLKILDFQFLSNLMKNHPNGMDSKYKSKNIQLKWP